MTTAEPPASACPADAVLERVPHGCVVQGLDHVGVAVPDLDAAIAFYSEMLGLIELHREVNVDQGVAEAMLGSVSPGPDAAQLQLLAPLSPESPIARFLGRSGPGLQQLAYRVADVDEATDVLRRRGVRLLYASARPGTAGSRINFIHPRDTGGVLVELVESTRPEGSDEEAPAATPA